MENNNNEEDSICGLIIKIFLFTHRVTFTLLAERRKHNQTFFTLEVPAKWTMRSNRAIVNNTVHQRNINNDKRMPFLL